SVVGAILVMLGAKGYYRDAYGEVEQQVVDPVPVPIFSPAGPVSPLENLQPRVTPIARHFLVTLALAGALFALLQAIPRPHILVQGDEALGQHPRILHENSDFFGGPPWEGSHTACTMREPSMIRALFAQTLYILVGSLFLGVLFWREGHRSQIHYLVLAVLLLGLSVLGTSLGFLAGEHGEVARNIDLLLPALVYPGVALLTCGSAMFLVGLLDHWQLVRALGPRVED
ncbi:MAG TPA: hypothetical protein VE685_20170, partial [Thermoanaerobaculia bacterium]|nr:hypothetical protein [Thermoanaerobaculia bacterium]